MGSSDASKRGRRNRRAGNAFQCQIARDLKALYPEARRGLQSRDGSEFADVEGTPWWVECKYHASIAVFRFLEQCIRDQTTRAVGRGKARKRVPREQPDERPRLLVLKEVGNGTPLACVEWPVFLEMLEAWERVRSER